MTLNEDLAVWLSGRPDWQKDAAARFCRGEVLQDKDITSIADKLIEGSFQTAPDIAASDIPGSTSTGNTVRLTEVSEVAGLNALIAGQTLQFNGTGLTIVFGNNASGKSGYARLIREAVTARVKSDRLLGNVFAEESTPPAAKLGYAVGSTGFNWHLGDDQNQDLSRIRFFDEDCGDAYVTKAAEVHYRPSALTIIDALSDACEAVSSELTRRLGANQAGRPQLPILHSGTAAAAFLSGLSATTTQESIEAATVLADDYDARLAGELAEKNRLEGSEPNKERARLSSLARDWKTIAQHATALANALSAKSLQQMKAQRKKAAELREAARIASATTFDSEPLTSVGTETWRALWQAARKYSVTEAFHDHAYPYVRDSAVCVLCQQPLTEIAADRLTRFQAFVTDTTSRDADAADALVAASRDELIQLQTLPLAVSAAANRLQESGEEVPTVLEWLSAASHLATDAVAWLASDDQSTPKAVTDDVSAHATNQAQALTDQAATIDGSTFAEKLSCVNKSVQDLQDAGALSESRSAIETEVARLAQRKRIEAVRRLTATNAVTTKRVELTETYVTQEVRDRFTRETERLQLRGVTLNRTGRGRESALKHQPTLLGTRRDADIDEILSEGEQTALGLAGFLTEVELDESLSGVVLDDPVSSLDATRRSRVAQRLVELAEKRQVIVFTHEITFVHALNKEAERKSISVTSRSIQRKGGYQPGLVTDKLPWQAKDIPQRIDGLNQDLARIKKERADLTDDQYAEQISLVAGRLSEALERAVTLAIVNELVDRGTNEVRPTMLKILPKFTQADHDEYQAAYAKTSSWAARHDNSPEENYVPPTVDEVQVEVDWLRGWHNRVKRYRS